MMNNRFVKAEILMIAVFFVGIVTGVFLTNFYEDRVRGDETEAVSGAPRLNTDRSPGRFDPRDRGDDEARRARFKQQAQRFHEYLGLNAQQISQIEAILEQTRGEFQKLSAETRTQYEMIGEGSRNKIRAMLTEEQRRKYDELIEKKEKQRERFRQRRDRK